MRILVINPNSDQDTLELIKKKVSLMNFEGVDFECIKLEKTPKLISTELDCLYATNELVEIVNKYDSLVDAYILACFSDPGLTVLREISSHPVLGIADSAMRMASYYGDRFSIITPTKRAGERKYLAMRKNYVDDLFNSIIISKSDKYEDMIEAGRQAIKDGSQMILLGCGNYVMDDKDMEQELEITVIDGLACAMGLAVSIVTYNKYKKSV